MTIELGTIRKAIAAFVSGVVVQGVAYVAAKAGVDPAIAAPVGVGISGVVAGIIYKIPNEISF